MCSSGSAGSATVESTVTRGWTVANSNATTAAMGAVLGMDVVLVSWSALPSGSSHLTLSVTPLASQEGVSDGGITTLLQSSDLLNLTLSVNTISRQQGGFTIMLMDTVDALLWQRACMSGSLL